MDPISDAVDEFQQRQTLELCELWAQPLYLRIAVLDELSFLVDKVLTSNDEEDLEGVEIDDVLTANIMSLCAAEPPCGGRSWSERVPLRAFSWQKRCSDVSGERSNSCGRLRDAVRS